MKLVISTASGLEAVTKRELEALGEVNPKAIDGKIEVDGDYEKLAKLSVWLRTADRIFIELASFHAETFDELFENIKKISFETYVSSDAKILMNGNCFSSKLMAIKSCGGVIKKAIVDRLVTFYKVPLEESGAEITIYFTIIKNDCKVYLDTSGDGLHKRGYRKLTYSAPLKETLAAGLVLLSVFKGDKPLADLFCGSGTIAIESAMIARNIAPNLNRNFTFENFVNFSKITLENVKKDAKTKENNILPNIFACDIDDGAIAMAKQNAKNAGVAEYIHFEKMDMRKFKPNQDYGVVISNPPYGDRLSTKNEVKKLYTDFFNMMKNYPTWSIYFLTDNKELESLIRRKATKRRKIYNAKIECTYYSFMGDKKNPTTATKVTNTALCHSERQRGI